MEVEKKQEKSVHHGRNVRCIRQSKEVKQSSLAEMIGLSQQAVSQIEQKRVIEPALLVKIAIALQIPVEILENMEEEATVSFYIENNTFEAKDNAIAGEIAENIYNNYCSLDEIKKLYEEKEALYELRLKDKQAEIDYLRKLLGERK